MSGMQRDAHQRLLAAVDAFDAIARVPGRPSPLVCAHALTSLLGVLDVLEGGIFLYHPQVRRLDLAAHSPADSILTQHTPQRVFAADSPNLAALAALHNSVQVGELASRPVPRRSMAAPMYDGATLFGVVQIVAGPEQTFSAEQRWLLETLTQRLAAAIRHAQHDPSTQLAQEHTRALVDASNDAILMLDSLGVVTMINRRAKYFFGLAERDIVGRNQAQLRAVFERIFEDSQTFEAWLAPLLASAEERAVTELRVLRAAPRLLQCFSAPVLDHHEQLLGRMLVFRDITRERAVEQMKTDFVSTVSHELRTPLTSIRGALQLVVGRPQQPELGQRTRELLEISLKNSERLIRLINDILDISKIEQGSLQLRRTSLDPLTLCQNAVQEVEAIAAGRNVALYIQAPNNLPPVSADQDRALQVLTNLLSNAIKFSEPGQLVELSAVQGGAMMYFAVRDQGRGIAPEDHERIFEKFHQLDSSLTRNASGTGLGLAICRALVGEQGGRIWLDSALGKGATFTFTLPVAGYEDPLATHGDFNQATILVADDNTATRQIIRAMLEHAGYQVAEADGGTAALQLARFLQPALITLDVMMPDLDGFDVAQLLHTDPLTQAIPVLFVSASGEEERAETLGTYLSKPFNSDELLRVIRRLMGAPRRHVLVMDDDYHVRPTLVQLLQRGGFVASEAGDARSGLAMLENNPPDLVLLDLRMPDADGFELIYKLKHDLRFSHIPIVVLTVRDGHPDAEMRAMALGAVRYLEKPISSDELLAEIERLLP